VEAPERSTGGIVRRLFRTVDGIHGVEMLGGKGVGTVRQPGGVEGGTSFAEPLTVGA
jgi:hypothetical protein